nr:immunoglobulin heavy chain junction region [Mus musculus]
CARRGYYGSSPFDYW